MLANFQSANSPTLLTVNLSPTTSPFSYSLQLPKDLPYPRLILRVTTSSPPGLGVTTLKVMADKGDSHLAK
jgi:hypothetical protein